MEKYNMLGLITQNDNVRVYKVREECTLCYYVLKIYPIERFNVLSREVRYQTLLRHPFIVEYIEWYKRKTSIFKIEEYCSGGCLADILSQDNQQIPPQCVRLFLIPIILALDYIHSRGYVYRALYPANIFLTTNGITKLASMKYTQPESDAIETRQDIFMHFPPEVLEQVIEEEVTGDTQLSETITSPAPQPVEQEKAKIYWGYKADAWSLGVLAYELLYNRFPYMVPYISETTLLNKIKTVKPVFSLVNTKEPVSESNQIDSQLYQLADDFISKLLEIDPEKRMSISEAKEHPFIKDCRFYKQVTESQQYKIFEEYRKTKAKRKQTKQSALRKRDIVVTNGELSPTLTSSTERNNILELNADPDIFKQKQDIGMSVNQIQIDKEQYKYEDLQVGWVVDTVSNSQVFELLQCYPEQYENPLIKQNVYKIMTRFENKPSKSEVLFYNIFIKGGTVEPWKFRLEEIPKELNKETNNEIMLLISAFANVYTFTYKISRQMIVYIYNTLQDNVRYIGSIFSRDIEVNIVETDERDNGKETIKMEKINFIKILNKLLSFVNPNAQLSLYCLIALLLNNYMNGYILCLEDPALDEDFREINFKLVQDFYDNFKTQYDTFDITKESSFSDKSILTQIIILNLYMCYCVNVYIAKDKAKLKHNDKILPFLDKTVFPLILDSMQANDTDYKCVCLKGISYYINSIPPELFLELMPFRLMRSILEAIHKYAPPLCIDKMSRDNNKVLYYISMILVQLYAKMKLLELRKCASEEETAQQAKNISIIKNAIFKILQNKYQLPALVKYVLISTTSETGLRILEFMLDFNNMFYSGTIINVLYAYIFEKSGAVQDVTLDILSKLILYYTSVWVLDQPIYYQNEVKPHKAANRAQIAAYFGNIIVGKLSFMVSLIMRSNPYLIKYNSKLQFSAIKRLASLPALNFTDRTDSAYYQIMSLNYYFDTTRKALELLTRKGIQDNSDEVDQLPILRIIHANINISGSVPFSQLVLNKYVLLYLVRISKQTLKHITHSVDDYIKAGQFDTVPFAIDMRYCELLEIIQKVNMVLAYNILHYTIRPNAVLFIKYMVFLVNGFAACKSKLTESVLPIYIKKQVCPQFESIQKFQEMCYKPIFNTLDDLYATLVSIMKSHVFCPSRTILNQVISTGTKTVKKMTGFSGLFKGELVAVTEILSNIQEIKQASAKLAEFCKLIIEETEANAKILKDPNFKPYLNDYTHSYRSILINTLVIIVEFLLYVDRDYLCTQFPSVYLKVLLKYMKDDTTEPKTYGVFMHAVREIISIFNERNTIECTQSINRFYTSIRDIFIKDVTSSIVHHIAREIKALLKESVGHQLKDAESRLSPSLLKELWCFEAIIKHIQSTGDFELSTYEQQSSEEKKQINIMMARDIKMVSCSISITEKIIKKTMKLEEKPNADMKIIPIQQEIYDFIAAVFSLFTKSEACYCDKLYPLVEHIAAYAQQVTEHMSFTYVSKQAEFKQQANTYKDLLYQLLGLLESSVFLTRRNSEEVARLGKKKCFFVNKLITLELSKHHIDADSETQDKIQRVCSAVDAYSDNPIWVNWFSPKPPCL